MSFQEELEKHFEEDKKNFKKIDDFIVSHKKDHDEVLKTLNKIGESVDNLQGLSDFFKGSALLKKPLMVVVGFIIALVALLGGLKTLLGFFLPTK